MKLRRTAVRGTSAMWFLCRIARKLPVFRFQWWWSAFYTYWQFFSP